MHLREFQLMFKAHNARSFLLCEVPLERVGDRVATFLAGGRTVNAASR